MNGLIWCFRKPRDTQLNEKFESLKKSTVALKALDAAGEKTPDVSTCTLKQEWVNLAIKGIKD